MSDEDLESIRKDAERYRYMRSNAAFQNRNGPGLYWYLERGNFGAPAGERLDSSIDDALRIKRSRNGNDTVR